MDDPQERYRLLLGQYPPQLSDDDLNTLSVWGESLWLESPALGSWFLEITSIEVARRERAEGGKYREVKYPKLPFWGWTCDDIVDTANCMSVLAEEPLSQKLEAFLRRLALAVSEAAATRLVSI